MDNDMRTTCPWCFCAHDAYTAGEDGTEPKPGDLSLCWRCGNPSFYTPLLQLRQPTPDERKNLEATDRWKNLRMAWEAANTPHELARLFQRLEAMDEG